MANNKRRPAKGVKRAAASALGEPRWAVIGDSYVSLDKTHDEARAEADDLKRRKQPGVVVVTNETANQMLAGLTPLEKLLILKS